MKEIDISGGKVLFRAHSLPLLEVFNVAYEVTNGKNIEFSYTNTPIVDSNKLVSSLGINQTLFTFNDGEGNTGTPLSLCLAFDKAKGLVPLTVESKGKNWFSSIYSKCNVRGHSLICLRQSKTEKIFDTINIDEVFSYNREINLLNRNDEKATITCKQKIENKANIGEQIIPFCTKMSLNKNGILSALCKNEKGQFGKETSIDLNQCIGSKFYPQLSEAEKKQYEEYKTLADFPLIVKGSGFKSIEGMKFWLTKMLQFRVEYSRKYTREIVFSKEFDLTQFIANSKGQLICRNGPIKEKRNAKIKPARFL